MIRPLHLATALLLAACTTAGYTVLTADRAAITTRIASVERAIVSSDAPEIIPIVAPRISSVLASDSSVSKALLRQDSAKLTREATSDGKAYRMSGQKTFNTHGRHAGLIIVVAKTDPAHCSNGVSPVVVKTEGTNAFQSGQNLAKIGKHASATSELFSSNAQIAPGNFLGSAPGEVMHDDRREQGGHGFIQECANGEMWTGARVHRISGGTNEIMKELNARSL